MGKQYIHCYMANDKNVNEAGFSQISCPNFNFAFSDVSKLGNFYLQGRATKFAEIDFFRQKCLFCKGRCFNVQFDVKNYCR